jgi:hypothetical protein
MSLEFLLSWGDADTGHNPSFNSCMARVPGAINSNNRAKVCVLEQWNGYRLSLRPLYRPFLNDLMTTEDRSSTTVTVKGKVSWMEKLYQTSVYDARKCAIQRIFCPYFIRRMSKEEAYTIIKDWCNRCLALPNARKLDVDIEYYLDWALRRRKDFSYLRPQTLKIVHPELYNHVISIM